MYVCINSRKTPAAKQRHPYLKVTIYRFPATLTISSVHLENKTCQRFDFWFITVLTRGLFYPNGFQFSELCGKPSATPTWIRLKLSWWRWCLGNFIALRNSDHCLFYSFLCKSELHGFKKCINGEHKLPKLAVGLHSFTNIFPSLNIIVPYSIHSRIRLAQLYSKPLLKVSNQGSLVRVINPISSIGASCQ